MFLTNIPVSAGNHNRFVISANFHSVYARRFGLKGAEITTDIGATKFVVKGGAPDRPLRHNIQCGDNSPGLAIVILPGLPVTGYMEIGHGETSEADFGFGAFTHRTLVAYFTAGAGTGA